MWKLEISVEKLLGNDPQLGVCHIGVSDLTAGLLWACATMQAEQLWRRPCIHFLKAAILAQYGSSASASQQPRSYVWWPYLFQTPWLSILTFLMSIRGPNSRNKNPQALFSIFPGVKHLHRVDTLLTQYRHQVGQVTMGHARHWLQVEWLVHMNLNDGDVKTHPTRPVRNLLGSWPPKSDERGKYVCHCGDLNINFQIFYPHKPERRTSWVTKIPRFQPSFCRSRFAIQTLHWSLIQSSFAQKMTMSLSGCVESRFRSIYSVNVLFVNRPIVSDKPWIWLATVPAPDVT